MSSSWRSEHLQVGCRSGHDLANLLNGRAAWSDETVLPFIGQIKDEPMGRKVLQRREEGVPVYVEGREIEVVEKVGSPVVVVLRHVIQKVVR